MLPTVILPGFLEAAIAYRPLEQFLQQLGFPTVTVPLQRRDWFPTLGGRPMTPILLQLNRTVKQVLQQYNASLVWFASSHTELGVFFGIGARAIRHSQFTIRN